MSAYELVIRVRFGGGVSNVGEALEAIASTTENWSVDLVNPEYAGGAPVIGLGPIWAGSTIIGGASIVDTEQVTR